MRFLKLCLVVGALLLLSVPASGQVPHDSLLALADSLLASGELARAGRLCRELLNEGEPLAYRGLGFIELKRERWDQAKKYFKTLLDSGADDLAAHYGLAIAYREVGARSAGILRATQWSFAEQHFVRVLERDSCYRDVLFQLALFERYKHHYFTAVALGLRQLTLKPDLEHAIFGQFSLYDYLLAHETPDTVEGWLLQDSSLYGRYFLAELYRRHEHFGLADSIFRTLLEEDLPYPQQPVLLSLARLHYVGGDPLLADEFYWRAVRSIDGDLAARFVFEDVKYIMDDAELAEYRRAKTPREKIAFFKRFWEKRNPRPGSPDNLRIREHYRRLVFAEREYRYDGFRLPVNDPDVAGYLRFPKTFFLNHKFNDKGLIYLRYGEPDRRATALGSELAHNESWLYTFPGLARPLMFHFEIDEDGGPNNWRLVPVPTDDRMLASREDWDPLITRYLHGSRMTRAELLSQLANVGREDVAIGLRHDRHTWSKKMMPIRCPFEVASFRGRRGRTDLELFFSVPRHIPNGPRRADSLWEFGAAVYDLGWNTKCQSRRIQTVNWDDSSLVADGYFVGAHRFSLVPGKYRVGFYAEGINTHVIAGYRFTVSVSNYNRARLAMSDVVLGVPGDDGSASVWQRGGVQLLPNPARRFAVGEPIWLYFEVYNLQLDRSGVARYAVELAVERMDGAGSRSLKNLFGLLGAGKRTLVTTRAERTVPSSDATEYLAVEMPGGSAGKYRLTVSVEDLVTGSRDQCVRDFELY